VDRPSSYGEEFERDAVALVRPGGRSTRPRELACATGRCATGEAGSGLKIRSKLSLGSERG
jgi:hypothetical protein